MRNHRSEARGQVEHERGDLRRRVRLKEKGEAVDHREHGRAVAEEHKVRGERLVRIADVAGLAIPEEDEHAAARCEGVQRQIPQVRCEPIHGRASTRDELQMLRLDGALLDHEDSGGGGDVAKGDEHEKRRESCEDELDCELLGTGQREWVVVHRIALLRG